MVQGRTLGGLVVRVLITGGFGFVGGRVAQHLQEIGHVALLGTRQVTGRADWLPGAIVVQTAWRDDVALEHICHEVDAIIHAAGMDAEDCAADPVAALEFNGLATARLVTAAASAGVKRFVYLSTAHVYASPLVGTISEETCPRNLHPYATSHLAGEQVVLQKAKCGQMESIVLRLSNAFGAPMHKDSNCWMLLVNDLCRQAVQTRRIVLRTSGLQHRDFVSMAEVCRVIGRLVENGVPEETTSTLNLGSGISQTVFEMAQLIQARCKRVLGFEVELHRPFATVGVSQEPLRYSGNGLKKAGLQAMQDPMAEIDQLLLFCHAQFGTGSL
jgi:UDP-glucose 4-epimerase